MKTQNLVSEDQLSSVAKKELNDEWVKGKIILLMDIGTKNLSCSRCGAGGDYGDTIIHKSCCSYIGGGGC